MRAATVAIGYADGFRRGPKNWGEVLVRGRRLDDAEDIAAVLHSRVDRWVEASSPGRRTRDRSVVGLIARPQYVDDEDMARALGERALAMERRALELVRRSLE